MLIHKGYQGSHFDYLGHSSVKGKTFPTNIPTRKICVIELSYLYQTSHVKVIENEIPDQVLSTSSKLYFLVTIKY